MSKTFDDTSVTRQVITYINKDGDRVLFGPQQGRNTFATVKEAEDHLAAIKKNNSIDTLASIVGDVDKMEVRPVKCWNGHFDPKTIYFF